MSKIPYFDNCEICKTIREADKKDISLSLEELKAVFDKQNKKNEKR